MRRHYLALICLLFLTACAAVEPRAPANVLPSWSEGPNRAAIVDFVSDVSDPANPDFIPEEQRIAVLDNDGTLWSEKPTYFQLLFILDRIRAMAPAHPEWRSTQPFQAVLENDMAALAASGEHGLIELVAAAQTGMSMQAFEAQVRDWIAIARHPVSGRPYTEMVYQPMLELMDYLRDNGFDVYIVSGGGIDFLRVWAEEVYGVPPQNVVGSSIKLRYVGDNGQPELLREPGMDFVNDKAGKPVGIQRHIGRRPVFAAGNSDGDFEMLEWTTSGGARRLGLIVHHTDAVREWAYDRDSTEGRLNRALDEAKARNWLLIDMARDWKVVFPPAP